MEPRYRTIRGLLLVLLIGVVSPTIALADCFISGVNTAEQNTTDPMLPAWRYTLTVTWDTGTPYALSHFDVRLSPAGHVCTCADFDATLDWFNPAGQSDGVPPVCEVNYDLFLECGGDPSIGLSDIMLKFEPIEDEYCEPGATGSGTFVFWSNLGPAPIAEPNLFLVDKFGQLVCYGELTGVFPSMPCDPVSDSAASWGTLKSDYR